MKSLLVLSTIACSLTASANQNFNVTAERLKKPVNQTSNAITVITSQDIANSPSDNLADLIQATPGVYISTAGSLGGVSTLRIRGGETGFSKIIIDNVEMIDPSNTNNSFELNQLDLNNIEQIEILRGSQSVIYGSESIGGVIKITTKKSQLPKTNINLKIGSYDTKELSFSSTGQKNKMTYSLAGSFLNTEGISSYNENRTVNAEKDRYNRTNLKSLLSYDLTSTAKLSYQLNVIKSDLDIDNFSSDKEDKDNSSYDQNTHYISYTDRFFADKLQSDLNYTYTEIYRNSESSSTNNIGTEKQIAWIGNHFINKSLTNVYGLQHEKLEVESSSSNAKETSSLFITSHQKFGMLFSDIGLRHDNHQTYDGHTTWKVGLGTKLPLNSILKATYATGFKAPTLSQLGYNKDLKPTESKNYDITFSLPFMQNFFELTYFNYEIENKIDYVSADSTYKNVKESEIEGFEVSLNMMFMNKLSWKNSFTYTDSLDKDTNESLLKTPEKLIKTSIGYMHGQNIKTSMSFRYVSERFDFGQVKVPSYLVGDLSLTYKNIKANVNNFLDKDYEDTRTYGTPGRNYGLSYKIEI